MWFKSHRVRGICAEIGPRASQHTHWFSGFRLAAPATALVVLTTTAAFAQGALTNGANHSGSISIAGEVDTWTFQASLNDNIALSVGEVIIGQDPGFVPFIRLIGPNAVQVDSDTGNLAAQINVRATLTGTYTVLIADSNINRPGTALGSYVLTLVNSPGAFVVSAGDEGGDVTIGANHAGVIGVGDLDPWSFQAAKDDTIALSLAEVIVGQTDPGFVPWIRLIGPDGLQLESDTGNLAAQINLRLPLTGTYTVLVADSNVNREGSATGSYLLRLVKAPGTVTVPVGDEGGAMTNGANHAGTIDVGDLDPWTFQASINDNLVLHIGETIAGEVDPGFVPWIRLIGPDGLQIGSDTGLLAAQIAIRATLTGSYTVIVADSNINREGSATGSYRLTLSRTPSAFTVPVGDEGGDLTNGGNHSGAIHVGDLDSWSFQAAKNDALSVYIGETIAGEVDPGFVPWIRLIGPDGAQIDSHTGLLAAQITVTAPLTGTYTVLVADSNINREGSATGSYVLRLVKAPGTIVVPAGDDGGAMTAGTNHSGAIGVGDLDPWTFQATQNDNVFVNVGEIIAGEVDPGFVPFIRLIGPNGVQLDSDVGNLAAQINVIAPLSGTYTIIIADSNINREGLATGSYRLTLFKTPGTFVVQAGDDGGQMTNGAQHAGSIHVGDLDGWTFTAVKNAALTVTMSEVLVGEVDPGFVPYIRLLSPTGALVDSATGTLTAKITVTAAPLTGTYTVIAADSNINREGLAAGTYLISVTGAIDGTNVNPPAILTQPQNRAIGNGQTAILSVLADGAAPLTYQWFAGTTGVTTSPVGGATLSSFTTPALSSTTSYWVRVTNPFGTADSATATVTVTTPTVTLDRAVLQFAATRAGNAFAQQTTGQAVRILQNGPGVVTWTATPSQPWITVSPPSGSGSALVTVGVTFSGVLPFSGSASGTVELTFTGVSNSAGPVTVNLTLVPSGTSTAPAGVFETPAEGAAGLTGSIAVTGWAVDDVQVVRVRILRDPVAGEGTVPIFIGNAVLVEGARPDVAAANPTKPLNTRAGWGYLLLTNFLPNGGNGTFRLRAIADDAEGNSIELGTRTITCANNQAVKPFGAIDTPGQGEVVSGLIPNFGWVLARGARRADPPNGGIVTVFVDGVLIGVPIGWSSRDDLTALFPVATFAGVGTALGVFSLDTTTFGNGVHTIFWIVTATDGQADGIGSRFFTISNGGSAVVEGSTGDPASELQPASVDSSNRSLAVSPSALMLPPAVAADELLARVNEAPADVGGVSGRRGLDLQAPLAALQSSASGQSLLEGEELDRFELHLKSEEVRLPSTELGPGKPHTTEITGYMRIGGELGPLPIGSRLDPDTGTFTWQLAAGFLHDYDLVFVRWHAGVAVSRREVRIVVNPRGSNRVGPQVVIDTPASAKATAGKPDQGVEVQQPFVVAGWAIDPDSSFGTGVDTLHVWAYPIDDPGNPIFLGAAAYGGSRPDVGGIYGERFRKSGYSLTVDSLPAGAYDLAVFAWSTATNGFVPAKVVRVTVR